MKPYDGLTFDCYGTLIDWYGGIRAAVRATPSLQGIDVERFVRDRDAADRALIAEPYRPYPEIVAESALRAAHAQARAMSEEEAFRFAASMARWPPFAESHESLLRLASKYRLAILSNVDRPTLDASIALLDAPFDLVVTADKVRSYKPRSSHWMEALLHLKLARSRILHVGCSLFHDIRPAQALGFPTAFVNREGEALQAGDEPTLMVPDLASLCAELL